MIHMRSLGVPYCPTEDDPPTMNAGLPAYLAFPPSSQGAVKFAVLPSGLWLKLGMSTVASPRGTDAAWSNEMFSGI